jgi:hypothetical protein
MKKLYSCILLILVSILPMASAFTLDATKLNQLIELSGAQKQVDTLPKDILKSLNTLLAYAKTKKDKKIQKEVNQTIYNSLSKLIHRINFKEVLTSNITEKELNEGLESFAKSLPKLAIC